MPFRRFEKNDLFYNQVKAFPKSDFIIYDSRVYYNGLRNDKGEFGNLHGHKQGFISLYELNVDRVIDKGSGAPPDGQSIYPFITKDGARIAFKTVSTSEFDMTSQFSYGDVIKGNYPLTSSIKRTRFGSTDASHVEISTSERYHGTFTKLTNNKRFINALKNTFNEYVNMSEHYRFERPGHANKATQEMSLIEIPSIFYGSSIRKGSVILQTFFSGTLVSECRDIKKNGELIQVSGTYNAATDNNKVAGVVLYNEGFFAMTGSWNLTHASVTDDYVSGQSRARWVDFGVGANDGHPRGSLENTMYRISFEGINYVPTITMFAHCPKGEFNNSTNPTAFVKSQIRDPSFDSSHYKEFQDLEFKQLEHSEYSISGSFEKQTYISKIGIYDNQKRLIAIAKLANPVRKTENREYTFKLKLDF